MHCSLFKIRLGGLCADRSAVATGLDNLEMGYTSPLDVLDTLANGLLTVEMDREQ